MPPPPQKTFSSVSLSSGTCRSYDLRRDKGINQRKRSVNMNMQKCWLYVFFLHFRNSKVISPVEPPCPWVTKKNVFSISCRAAHVIVSRCWSATLGKWLLFFCSPISLNWGESALFLYPRLELIPPEFRRSFASCPLGIFRYLFDFFGKNPSVISSRG